MEVLMSDASIPDRLRSVEIQINGNGGNGLLQRVKQNENDIRTLDSRADDLQLHKVDHSVCNKHIEKDSVQMDKMEKRLEQRVIEVIEKQEKKWIRHLGPVLTGIAAILAVLLNYGG